MKAVHQNCRFLSLKPRTYIASELDEQKIKKCQIVSNHTSCLKFEGSSPVPSTPHTPQRVNSQKKPTRLNTSGNRRWTDAMQLLFLPPLLHCTASSLPACPWHGIAAIIVTRENSDRQISRLKEGRKKKRMRDGDDHDAESSGDIAAHSNCRHALVCLTHSLLTAGQKGGRGT